MDYDVVAERGKPRVRTRFSLGVEDEHAGAGQDGRTCLVRPTSQERTRGQEKMQEKMHFSCSADHVQDWQPYPVDPYCGKSSGRTYIHTFVF